MEGALLHHQPQSQTYHPATKVQLWSQSLSRRPQRRSRRGLAAAKGGAELHPQAPHPSYTLSLDRSALRKEARGGGPLAPACTCNVGVVGSLLPAHTQAKKSASHTAKDAISV